MSFSNNPKTPHPERPVSSRLAAILLAAGDSSRLGRPKQLLIWQGEALLHRAARMALEAGCKPVVVVGGAFAPEVEAAVADLEVDFIFNENWQEGMGTSLQKALAYFSDISSDAYLLLLSDQPFLSVAHLARMIRRFQAQPGQVVASAYADSLGVPVIFPASLLSAEKLPSVRWGAKQILKKLPAEAISTIPFPKGEIDIDTEEDWDNLQNS